MTDTIRPVLRVATRPVRQHALATPEGAPSCYGDLRTRSERRGCASCPVTTHCADRLDLLSHDARLEVAPCPEGRTMIRVGDDARMIIDQHRCRVRVSSGRLAHREDIWRRYIAQEVDRDVDDRLARLAWDPAAGGLITVSAAVELSVVADAFRLWLETSAAPRMDPARARRAAEVWLTAAITRRALAWQGRPAAFRPGLHHEIWLEMTGVPMSRSALRHRLIRVERWFALFAAEAESPFVPPLAA